MKVVSPVLIASLYSISVKHTHGIIPWFSVSMSICIVLPNFDFLKNRMKTDIWNASALNHQLYKTGREISKCQWNFCKLFEQADFCSCLSFSLAKWQLLSQHNLSCIKPCTLHTVTAYSEWDWEDLAAPMLSSPGLLLWYTKPQLARQAALQRKRCTGVSKIGLYRLFLGRRKAKINSIFKNKQKKDP